jgi:hypothetical protein
MMSKDTGGSAFPSEQHECQDNTWNQTFDSGMTLRDYFAAKAMQALIPIYANDTDRGGTGFNVTEKSYSIADAMIAERDKP